MCCCKKEVPHDETMKFLIKVTEDYVNFKDKDYSLRYEIKNTISKLDTN